MAKVILPPDEDILPPSDDHIFKTLVTSADAKPVLMDIISVVIGRKVVSVEIRGNELPANDVHEKNERLDVNCTIDDGSAVNVEMQGTPMTEVDSGNKNFMNRLVYYLTDLHSSQASKGVEYYKLNRTYQITFSMGTIFTDRSGYITYGNLRRENGELLTDQINLAIIELSKMGDILNKPLDDMTPLEMWSVFLGYAADPKRRELINRIIERKEEIGMAGAALLGISRNEDERAHYLSRKKFENDRLSEIATYKEIGRREGVVEGEARGRAEGEAQGRVEGEARGRAEGEARGRAEGEAQAMRNLAREMKADDIPLERIAKLTKLSVAEINAL